MVDHIQHHSDNPDIRMVELIADVAHPYSPLKICPCDRCEKLIYGHAVKPKFAGYSQINPRVVEQLTEHQYFLCERGAPAFVFKVREWSQ